MRHGAQKGELLSEFLDITVHPNLTGTYSYLLAYLQCIQILTSNCRFIYNKPSCIISAHIHTPFPMHPLPLNRGWTIQGDCFTSTTYIPQGSSRQYSLSNRCNGGWSQAVVRQAAASAGCFVAGTLCGPAALVCRAACSLLVGVAQGQCLDSGAINAMFNAAHRKSSFVCCNKCTAYYKLTGRCP